MCFDREGWGGGGGGDGRRTSTACVRVKHTDMYGSSAVVADRSRIATLFPFTNLNSSQFTRVTLTNRSSYPDFVRESHFRVGDPRRLTARRPPRATGMRTKSVRKRAV